MDLENLQSEEPDLDFAYLVSSAKRRTEAVLRKMTSEERAQMDKAKNKELDQWVKHSVFTIARRTGIPEHRIMSMRWVLTWKDVAP